MSKQYPGLEVYLAIPSLSLAERRSVISSLEKFKIAVRTIPSLHDLVANQKKMVEMQDLNIHDIFTKRSCKKIFCIFFGLTLMITGAGGSIGSEIVRQALSGNPKKIVLLELSETNLYLIQEWKSESIINGKEL